MISFYDKYISFRILFLFFGITLFNLNSQALPAFARRENVSCTLCHSNGSAPHLTKVGYEYRRAGFRFPNDIGDLEKDNRAASLANHISIGAGVDYHVAVEKALGGSAMSVDNEFDLREVALWPLIGAFLGNFAVWSEFDMSPQVAATPYRGPAGTGQGPTSSPSGDVSLSQADLRYVWGSPDSYINARVGFLAPEGFGASDQWIDDGAIALMDTQTAQFNGVDTLVTPLGPMQSSQTGMEIGANYKDSHFTLGIMNGFDGTNGLENGVQSTATPGLMSPERKGEKDYKAQFDQFIGDQFALTGVYYKGKVSLLDPGNTLVWQNNYSLERLYLTYLAIPNVVDLYAGAGTGTFDWVNTGNATVAGHFNSRGGFIGASYYLENLTLSAHLDKFYYAYGEPVSPKASQYTLMAGVPYENNIFIFHVIHTDSDIAGLSDDYRLEWRFLF